jgi:hypothetical protein
MRYNNQPVWMKTGVEDGHKRRWHDKMICENQPAIERQTRGEVPVDKRRWHVVRQRQLVLRQRQRVERTRDRGRVSRGWVAAAAQQQGWHDNQLANKRPTRGEAFADKRRWIVERTRSGSGATRGVLTISRRH